MSVTVNPVEELLKAIEIVHGPAVAALWRRIWWAVQDKHRWDCVEWD